MRANKRSNSCNIIRWKEHSVILSAGQHNEIFNTAGLSDAEITEKIRGFLKRTKTTRLLWLPVVPTHEVLLRAVTVPSCDEQEARKMIGWQAQGRWGDEKDLVTDHIWAPSSEAGTKGLIGVIEQTVLTRYWNMMCAAGVLFNDWSVDCLLTKNFVNDHGEGDHGFLYFEGERCDLCFLRNRWPVFVRSFVIGEEILRGERSAVLWQQIDISLKAYQQEHKTNISRIIIVGKEKEPDVFKRSLEEKIPAVSFFFDSLTTDVCRKDILTFRWVPSTIKEEKIKKFYACQWTVLVFLSILFISSIFSFIGIRYCKEVAYLHQTRRQEDALHQQVQELQRMKQQVNMVVQKYHQRVMVSDLWGELDALRPASLYLTRLEWHAKSGMMMQGIAASEADVNEWQKKLAASHLFDDVILQSAQRQRDGSGENVYFKIRSTPIKEEDH